MLSLNPVVITKHFQYTVEILFRPTEVLLTNTKPISNIV